MAVSLTRLAFGGCQGNVFRSPAITPGAWNGHFQLLPRCHDSKAALQSLWDCVEGQPGVDLHLEGSQGSPPDHAP
ncbi:hypothetical protein HaLaN_16937 [Haematococcus lacustris]|uniref:Uncharacterized protein n=1 Tax=Haematococcus lacustris TaxID=44745 RepID=A0A699ZB64_HAELA|nr:hypothetical protein HaLaN_16937 [Haematococcus lacustris]